MRCALRNLALAVAVTSTIQPAYGQTFRDPGQNRQPPLLTTSPTLLASLKRISKGSALWREAIEDVRKTTRRVLVVTPAEVSFTDGSRSQDRKGFDPSVLAEAIPVVAEDSQVSLVVVVVNLRVIQENHDARMSVLRQFEADLDRILVHEIYGHAVPLLLAGNLTGRCPDPNRGEAASDACSIRRENAVRAELGLGRREDPGIYSLALAMGTR